MNSLPNPLMPLTIEQNSESDLGGIQIGWIVTLGIFSEEVASRLLNEGYAPFLYIDDQSGELAWRLDFINEIIGFKGLP
jgi:hypothetical protein